MKLKKFKFIRLISTSIITLLLSACFGDSDDTEQNFSDITKSMAPGFNADGSFTQDDNSYAYTPQDIHEAYNLNAFYDLGFHGKGKVIVLIDAYGSQTAEADLTEFHNAYFSSFDTPDFQQIFPDNVSPDYDDDVADFWAEETSLDIQWSYAMAPSAAINVVVAQSEASTDLLSALEYVIENYSSGTVVSMSFALPEEELGRIEIDVLETQFKKGIEKGLTFFASAGDFGSTSQRSESTQENQPSVNYPASSAYVTAVGGTFLQYGWTWEPTSNEPYLDYDPSTGQGTETNSDYFSYSNDLLVKSRVEAMWNEAWIPSATGGGVSEYISLPEWQSNNTAVYEAINNNENGLTAKRGIPDLSWNAAKFGGVYIYVNGTWLVVGGTSASAPQTAGFMTLVNEYLSNQGLDNMGYLNQWLYQMSDIDIDSDSESESGQSAFNDIQSLTFGTDIIAGELTNNVLFQFNSDGFVSPGNTLGYSVAEGWDLTTGFGSPNGIYFAEALATVMSEAD